MRINAYATLRTVPEPGPFARGVQRRDRRDPQLAPHLQGFVGYVARDGRMDARRFHLIQHLQRVQNHLAFEVNTADAGRLAAWLAQANAVAFHEDGSVRDPAGRMLHNPAGEPDPESDVPYQADAVARKQASEALLTSRGLRALETLPPVVAQGEVVLRSAQDVARRALALTIVAVRGESILEGRPLTAQALRERQPLGFAALSPAEAALMQDGRALPDQHAATQAVWRYEAAATLLWALGQRKALPFPEAVINVPEMVGAVLALDADGFVRGAQLRSETEILDALDQTYRLAWIARQAQRAGPPPTVFNADVVQERHHTLNWLTRYEDADWDDVQTHT